MCQCISHRSRIWYSSHEFAVCRRSSHQGGKRPTLADTSATCALGALELRCVQARSADAMQQVLPRDELFGPARPTVIQMDFSFGGDSQNKSQVTRVEGDGLDQYSHGFCWSDCYSREGRKTCVFVEMGRTCSHALVCSEVCDSDRP